MEREPEPGQKRWSVYRTPGSRRTEQGGAQQTTKPEPAARSVPLTDAPVTTTPRTSRTSSVGIGFAVLLLVVVGGVIAVFSIVVDGATGGDTVADGLFGTSKVNVLTVDGINDLVAAVKEETGSTMVFGATIYPGYASVAVPADGSSKREIGYRWDGRDLEATGSKGQSSNRRLDLAQIDAAVVPRLVAKAKAQVEDPNTWYLIVGRDSFDGRGWMAAYANNEFSEGGYILADRNGRELRRTTW